MKAFLMGERGDTLEQIIISAISRFEKMHASFDSVVCETDTDAIARKLETLIQHILDYPCETLEDFEQKLSFMFHYVFEQTDASNEIYHKRVLADLAKLRQELES